MQKTILITGGTGYIGSHAVVAFEEAGYKTVIIDNLANSSRDTLASLEKILGYCPDFYECDIRDRDGLEVIFQKYNFDGVIHFAGLKAFSESVKNPYKYFDNNITGSLTLFDIMDGHNVRNIVFSSSASVYDGSNIPPFTEDMRLGTTNPYATTKLNIENILRDYARQKGFHSAILRYFNLIGAHPSGELGDFPQGDYGSLATNIFDVVFGKKQTLSIYGNDFPTEDGTAIRDYIDVNDLIEGHIFAYQWAQKQEIGIWGAWNLGTGRGISVRNMIQSVEKIIGYTIAVEELPRRIFDLSNPISNPEKFEKDFGWSATRTLEASLDTMHKAFTRKYTP